MSDLPVEAGSAQTPLVSVLVPVYNVAPYLDECLSSIVEQDYRNLEIILIDDASTDGSGAALDAWAVKDERIQVVHKAANAGLSNSRNMSTSRAWGDYIAFIDSDDYVRHDMISKLLAAVLEHDADVAVCGWSELDENGCVDRPLAVETGTVTDAEYALEYCLSEIGDSRYHRYIWNKLYRRGVTLDETGQPIRFNERLSCYADGAWLIKVLLRSEKVAFVNECLYVYRPKRPGNATTSALVDARRSIDSVRAITEDIGLLEGAGVAAVKNDRQRLLLYRQRGMYAALASNNEEVWRFCADHYLRDVFVWLASSPSPKHVVWCAKRVIRRIQLAALHQKAQRSRA